MVNRKQCTALTAMHVHCLFTLYARNIVSASLEPENAQNMADDNAYLMFCSCNAAPEARTAAIVLSSGQGYHALSGACPQPLVSPILSRSTVCPY